MVHCALRFDRCLSFVVCMLCLVDVCFSLVVACRSLLSVVRCLLFVACLLVFWCFGVFVFVVWVPWCLVVVGQWLMFVGCCLYNEYCL